MIPFVQIVQNKLGGISVASQRVVETPRVLLAGFSGRKKRARTSLRSPSMAIWRGKPLFRMTNVAESCIAHQSPNAKRAEIMNRALILLNSKPEAMTARSVTAWLRDCDGRDHSKKLSNPISIWRCHPCRCAGPRSCSRGQPGGRCAGFPMLQIRMAEDACRSDSVPGRRPGSRRRCWRRAASTRLFFVAPASSSGNCVSSESFRRRRRTTAATFKKNRGTYLGYR